jgi:carbamoyltransferase
VSIILGINAYHGDSSACLVKDGTLIAAAEEERFRRVKHWAGLPIEAIKFCLFELNIALADLDVLAINQDTSANLWRKIRYVAAMRPDLSLLADRVRNRRERSGIAEELQRSFDGQTLDAKVRGIEHHMAHLGSAFLVSPFNEAVAVSVDGFGDFASAAWGLGVGNRIHLAEKVYFPHSLGIFYQALTQFLGFPNYGDEYKVMGLAPYGEPRYMPEMRKLVFLEDDGSFRLNLEYFRHHQEKIAYEWESGEPAFGQLYSLALTDLLGKPRVGDEPLTQRHRDLARSVQGMYEEAFFHLLNRLYERYRVEALAIAGGCGMNSVANGKVYRNTPFKRLYIQSAAGDAGGAIGAAFVACYEECSSDRHFIMDHAYYGPQFGDAEFETVLAIRRDDLAAQRCVIERISDESTLCDRTAQAIANGSVIGWFQGRMEWGPRALGNRSILGDPRRSDMKDILNLKIKRRESFRPFAPSVLREAVPEWFETNDDVPFMMQVYPIRDERRAQIPAVTHVDGSGRLQTVTRETNSRYYKLIEAFGQITGVPMVLNTSFNENEPVVCKPEEALDCFLRTKMDVLVLGNWYIERQPDSPAGVV